MVTLNGLQDQTFLYVASSLGVLGNAGNIDIIGTCNTYTMLFKDFVNPLLSNQPLYSFYLLLFMSVFKSYSVLILSILQVLITIGIGYLVFRKRSYWWFYVFIFTFSSYTWTQLGVHQDLIASWLVLLLIFLVDKLLFTPLLLKRYVIYLTFLLLLGSLFSNYLGFVMAVTLVSYLLVVWVVRISDFRRRLKYTCYIALSLTLFSVVLCLLLFPYINSVYINSGAALEASQTFNRPYEDFFTFSLRPWYFLVPHPGNFLYGDFSNFLVGRVAQTGYFLADDYFPAEHSSAFFGYGLLLTIVLSSVFSLCNSSTESRKRILLYVLTILILFLFTLPPFFTVNGVQIFTPGYLIYKFFPIFRVTSRFTVAILSLSLFIVAEFIDKTKINKRFLNVFMPLLLIITLAETYVPPKIAVYDKVPPPYVYMGTQVPMKIKFLVYPYSKSNESLFWMPDHKQCLMNVRGYVYEKISAEDLTLRLFEPGMLGEAKDLGVTHVLIYQPDTYTKDVSSTSQLELVEKFSDSALYKVK